MKLKFDDYLMLLIWLNIAIVIIYVGWIMKNYGTGIAMATLFHF